VVRGTPKVTGFISTGKKPTPLTEQEINEVVNRVSVTAEQPKPKFTFDHGDAVKIIEGPFKDFTGVVEDVNPDRNTLKVMLTILGRATPVELESEQVEKDYELRSRSGPEGFRGAPTGSCHGEKDCRKHQTAGFGRESNAGPAGRIGAGPSWPEHHGLLQGL